MKDKMMEGTERSYENMLNEKKPMAKKGKKKIKSIADLKAVAKEKLEKKS